MNIDIISLIMLFFSGILVGIGIGRASLSKKLIKEVKDLVEKSKVSGGKDDYKQGFYIKLDDVNRIIKEEKGEVYKKIK